MIAHLYNLERTNRITLVNHSNWPRVLPRVQKTPVFLEVLPLLCSLVSLGSDPSQTREYDRIFFIYTTLSGQTESSLCEKYTRIHHSSERVLVLIPWFSLCVLPTTVQTRNQFRAKNGGRFVWLVFFLECFFLNSIFVGIGLCLLLHFFYFFIFLQPSCFSMSLILT